MTKRIATKFNFALREPYLSYVIQNIDIAEFILRQPMQRQYVTMCNTRSVGVVTLFLNQRYNHVSTRYGVLSTRETMRRYWYYKIPPRVNRAPLLLQT